MNVGKYCQSAKHLNFRHPRLALFFNRFNCHLSHRHGSTNTKPDALSHIHSPDAVPEEPEFILPWTCILGALGWEVNGENGEELEEVAVPSDCLPNRLFVVANLRSAVTHWANASLFACHPGVKRTIFVIKDFGGQPSLRMWQNTSPPVQCVPEIKDPTKLPQDFFNPFLSPVIHGHTYYWISSPDCPSQTVTL